jgi:hypothetical protein
MKLTLLFVVAVLVVSASGCSMGKEQHISVVIKRNGSPAVGTEVRSYNAKNCEGPHGTKQPAFDGWLEFNRSTKLDGVHDVTEELSICVEMQGSWRPLLSTVNGAGPSRIDLICELGGPSPTCDTKFDGVTPKEWSVAHQ